MARLTTHPSRLERQVPPRAAAGLASVVLHVLLLLVLASAGSRHHGATEHDDVAPRLLLLELPQPDRRQAVELTSLPPNLRAGAGRLEWPDIRNLQPPALPLPGPDAPGGALVAMDGADAVEDARPLAVPAPGDIAVDLPAETTSTVSMSPPQASALVQRIERIADRQLATSPSAHATWQQGGAQYRAELVLQPAGNDVEADRVVAEVEAAEGGRHLRTRLLLRRVSLAQFTQIVESWDPRVQFHDDEIVGRLHVNSRFSLLSDAEATPTLRGKVSTAADGFDLRSPARGTATAVFRGGIETRAGRIAFSRQLQPLEFPPRDANARVHALAGDTRIRFLENGGYWWRDLKSGTQSYDDSAAGRSVYFVAAPGATLYVQGRVAGKVLVYSPQRIVVEGSLTYVRDPRSDADSGDYLGLVCDKDIELASPRVTGPGDIEIQGALLAKRRFVVAGYEHAQPATLRIYGSLAAGTLSASEPRYATRIEFDPRFERLRPPGFPTLARFVADEWDGLWTDVTPQQLTGR